MNVFFLYDARFINLCTFISIHHCAPSNIIKIKLARAPATTHQSRLAMKPVLTLGGRGDHRKKTFLEMTCRIPLQELTTVLLFIIIFLHLKAVTAQKKTWN